RDAVTRRRKRRYDAESRRDSTELVEVRERRYDAASRSLESMTRGKLAKSSISCRNTSGISAQRRRNVRRLVTFRFDTSPRPPASPRAELVERPPPNFAQTASAYAESAEVTRRDRVQSP